MEFKNRSGSKIKCAAILSVENVNKHLHKDWKTTNDGDKIFNQQEVIGQPRKKKQNHASKLSTLLHTAPWLYNLQRTYTFTIFAFNFIYHNFLLHFNIMTRTLHAVVVLPNV